MRTSNDGTYAIRRAATIGLLACISIAMTAWAVGAREPADEVERARQAAERAAAAESALEELGDDDPATDAAPANPLRQFGDAVSPVDLSVIPDDWEEAGLDPNAAQRRDDKLVQTLSNGLEVVLTIEPEVQEQLERVLDDYEVPHGGVVVVEPDSGRVLAMVSHTADSPELPDLATRATAPAASTFKVVTAAALLQSAGVDWRNEICYHGGASELDEDDITGNPEEDDRCKHLGDALAWSINAIIARLAYRHLDRNDLRKWAKRFGFNRDIPFELSVEQSTAEIVREPLERARTAAGFWHTYLSPLHGALIGAALENGGLLMRPSIIEEVRIPEGRTLQTFERKVLQRVMSEQTAERLGDLLEGTAEKGTASHRFEGRAAYPNDVQTAGKTGTLANHDPYLSFTWFVGFARHQSVEDRDAAVGSLLCNSPNWRIKGPYAASEGLREFFELRERQSDDEPKQLAEK